MLWLISDKHDEYASLLHELNSAGYPVKGFRKISDAFNHLEFESPEGILIDADHTEVSCLEFCHRIKSVSGLKKTQLIIISGNTSESIEVSMFEAGADEFVTKPIRLKALLKRINVRLHQPLENFSILFRINGKSALQIDKESFSVYLNQRLVPLSRKEFELLHLMACHPGKIFTRDEIFKKIWKRKPNEKDRTIDVHILRLRKKLGDEFISTQKGVGYRFCA